MIFVKMAVSTAVQELRRSFLRAVLSLLAIAIGIMSLVLSQGVAAGVFSGIRDYIKATGGLQVLRVFDRDLVDNSPRRKFWRRLDQSDVAILERRLPPEVLIAPEVGFGSTPFTHGGRAVGNLLIGGTPTYGAVNSQTVVAGRSITEHDIVHQSKVIVISWEVLKGLFPHRPPRHVLGEIVRVAGSPFRVVGVFGEHVLPAAREKQVRLMTNRFNLIPISVAQAFYGPATNAVTGIHIRSADVESIAALETQIEAIVRSNRGGVLDFVIQSLQSEVDGWRRTEQSIRLGLMILSILTLLAGGVGIVNVMLASVQERSKEIGIRKAIGASQTAIGAQFLIEAAVLSVAGGAVGVAASFGAIPLIGDFFTKELPGHPILLPQSIVIGMVCSGLVGILAGIYPALIAAHKMPLVAIRND